MRVAYAHVLGRRWMALPADLRRSRRRQDLGSFRAAHGPRRFQAVCVSADQSIAPGLKMFDRVLEKAPLTEHLTNGQFRTILAKLLNYTAETVPVKVNPVLCRCGCRQSVTPGRKFVNQQHYDRSKGLPASETEQLIARFRQGVPKKQLAREYGIALSTVKRVLKKQGC